MKNETLKSHKIEKKEEQKRKTEENWNDIK